MAIRSRDVRNYIGSMGFERGITHSLETMIEENISLKQNMLDMANMLARVIDALDQLGVAGDTMRRQLEELRRRDEQYAAVRSEDPKPPV